MVDRFSFGREVNCTDKRALETIANRRLRLVGERGDPLSKRDQDLRQS